MRGGLFFSLVLILIPCLLLADTGKPPTQAVLDSITARGRMLAEYDKAVEFASDEVSNSVEAKPPNDRIKRYIAVKEKTGWKVYFGRLDAKESAYLVAYEAVQKGSSLQAFQVKDHKEPLAMKGFLVSAAKAITLALGSFKTEKRPYNVAALPAPNGQIWVYVFPARTKADVWPLGGDARYLISGDGTKIVATHRMHNTILELPAPPEGETPAAGYHTAVLDTVPEDTDVFHVLSRHPTRPEYVVTQNFVYMIQNDGSIKYQGTREAFGKKGTGKL